MQTCNMDERTNEEKLKDLAKQANQCQGCQAGWKTKKHNPYGGGSMEFHEVEGGYDGELVFCTKNRYITKA